MPTASSAEGSGHGPVDSEAFARVARYTVPALIAIGLALRLSYFLLNPSLSNDEASLGLNLLHRSYGGLFERLNFNQAAPPGFLVLEKAATDVLGTSTYSLRLLPFLAGAAGCLLIYPVAARIVGRPAAIVALALFSVSTPLVSYTATSKQYSGDAAIALGLLAMMLLIRRRFDTSESVLLGLVGAVAIFFSHPAAFVIAAIWLALTAEHVAARKRRQLANLIGLGAAWSASITAAYFLTRTSLEQIQRSVGSGPDAGRLSLRVIGGIARYLLGVPDFAPGVRAVITCLALVLCFAGAGALLRTSPGLTAVLVVPAMLAGAAVWVGLYPSFGRAFLFAEPALGVLIASGAWTLSHDRRHAFRVGTYAALVVIFGVVLFQTLRQLRPSTVAEPTRALSYLAEHTRTGDSLYVARTAQYTFRYYLECGCFAASSVVAKARRLWPIRPTAGYGQFDAALETAPPYLIAGTSTGSSERDYADDFAPLLGRERVWVLLFDLNPSSRQALEAYLEDHGRLRAAFPAHDGDAAASALLYSLRPR